MIHSGVQAIVWQSNSLQLLDQRYLPAKRVTVDCHTAVNVAEAITQMVVRGAPAIGIAAAYAVVLAAQHRHAKQPDQWRKQVLSDIKLLAKSRPTAVNLFWALQRMQGLIENGADPAELETEAVGIHHADLQANLAMGDLGAALIESGKAVLTHCNTGSLATGGYGTALGVIRSAHKYGKIEQVYADETRPWLQGSRLTAWELAEDGIDCTLIAEGAAASLLRTGRIGWVIVGADRIAANGDVANKIGTYSLAVLARQHGVKFMVVAPSSTLDLQTANGDGIAIEERPADELVAAAGYGVLPAGVSAWNPVFDMTPAKLIDALVTERGVVSPPTQDGIAAMLG